MKTVKESAMKKTECLSLVSLAVTGAFYGAPQAIALPLLDSDLASFTGLGTSVRNNTPDGGRGNVNASNASPGEAVLALQTADGHGGNGNPAANSGNSGYPAAWTNPGYRGRGNPWTTPDMDDAIRHPGVNGHAAKPDKPSVALGDDKGDVAKDKDLCGRLLANNGGITLDQDRLADFCADVPEEIAVLEVATNPEGSIDEPYVPATGVYHGLGGVDAPESVLDEATTPDSPSDEALVLAPNLLAVEAPEIGPEIAPLSVPEPATLALLLAGVAGLAGVGGSRRTKAR